jgi:hypothetical protein
MMVNKKGLTKSNILLTHPPLYSPFPYREGGNRSQQIGERAGKACSFAYLLNNLKKDNTDVIIY